MRAIFIFILFFIFIFLLCVIFGFGRRNADSYESAQNMRARLVALALAASALPIVSSQGWSALPFAATGTDGAVSALAFLDCSGAAPAGLCAAGGPALLVGGAFSSIGGLPAGSSGARGVAAFLPSASAWALAAPSGGLDGPASALAASEDGIVYVGGFFDTAGGVAASNIAALNASEGTWSAMGVGLDAACKALALQGGMLYAGGLFSTAGGVAASRVAAYSLVTGEWTALGTNTVDNYVYALLGGVVLPGVASGVALAGAFSKPSLSISLWDPAQAAYDLPGAGLPIRNRGTLALAVGLGAQLLAGGDFASPGAGLASYSSAQSSWASLGGGVSMAVLGAAVQALAAPAAGAAAGSLFVGGIFTAAGGGAYVNASLTNISNIVRYDGSAWWDLAGGVTGGGGLGVLALLAAPDGTLYVAGDFSAAGGAAAASIAAWVQPPSPSVSATLSPSPSTSTSMSTAASTTASASASPVSPSGSASTSTSPSTSVSATTSPTGTPPPPSPAAQPVAPLPAVVIVSSSIGGVAAAAIVIGVFLTYRRSRTVYRRSHGSGSAGGSGRGGGGGGTDDGGGDGGDDALSRLELAGSVSEQQRTPLLDKQKLNGEAAAVAAAAAAEAAADATDLAAAIAAADSADAAASVAVAHATVSASPSDVVSDTHVRTDVKEPVADYEPPTVAGAGRGSDARVEGEDEAAARPPPPAPLRTPHDVDAAARIIQAAPTYHPAPKAQQPRAFLRDT